MGGYRPGRRDRTPLFSGRFGRDRRCVFDDFSLHLRRLRLRSWFGRIFGRRDGFEAGVGVFGDVAFVGQPEEVLGHGFAGGFFGGFEGDDGDFGSAG